MKPVLDVDAARARFPSLPGEWVFLDNAGGSQCLETVAERARDYLLHSNVQLGASYQPSVEAGARVAAGRAAIADWMGAASPQEVVLGPSTTQLMMTFAASFGRHLERGDAVVVTDVDHEANVGPWRRLADRGIEIRTWKVDGETWELRADDLAPLLDDRVKLVCFTAASNLIGSITPIREIVDVAHAHGALACVDAVALAPHRLLEPVEWGADLVAFSLYKTYGPHLAALRAPAALLGELPKVNHFFVADDAGPAKFEPGNVNYELTWAAGAVVDYLEALAPGTGATTRRERLASSFDAIAAHEERLAARLLEFLAGRDRVRVWGRSEPDATRRVPTISFTVEGRTSRSVVEHLDARRLGARHGHFYARHLVDRMGLDPDDGVVRVSLVHLNTLDEVERLIEALADVT